MIHKCKFCKKTFIGAVASELVKSHEEACSSRKVRPSNKATEYPMISIPSDWLTKEIGKNIK